MAFLEDSCLRGRGLLIEVQPASLRLYRGIGIMSWLIIVERGILASCCSVDIGAKLFRQLSGR